MFVVCWLWLLGVGSRTVKRRFKVLTLRVLNELENYSYILNIRKFTILSCITILYTCTILKLFCIFFEALEDQQQPRPFAMSFEDQIRAIEKLMIKVIEDVHESEKGFVDHSELINYVL